MENMEEVMLNGEKVILPKAATEEEMNDLVLEDEIPTKDLTEVLEKTKEIDWSQNE